MARKHYLGFLAQCFAAVEADESLIGISGWNENGMSSISFCIYVQVGVGF